MPKRMTLEEFERAFQSLRNQGWVRSCRRGPTGIGHTLEKYIGLQENNIALPDLDKAELKAHRANCASMITLFTFNRKAWIMRPLDAIRKFGTHDMNGRLGLYSTTSLTPNSLDLFLHVDTESLFLRHVSGEVIAKWTFSALEQQFERKLPAMLLVSAFSEMRGDVEYLRFDRAQLLSGSNPCIIRNQILAGNVLVDLRLYDKTTRARNHGTGFRTREDRLPLLFENVKEL